MLLALSDTHSLTELDLTDHLGERIGTADLVLHAGDFTTTDVLDGFRRRADRLVAVQGNSDASGVREQVPDTRTVEWEGRRFLVVHGHRHDPTSLGLLARQEEADVVVVGHTHQGTIDDVGGVTVVNPGSHADPRGNRATYAAVGGANGEVTCRLRGAASGETLETTVL